MKNTLRKNNGITLIALVITIIVLLILAGIAIASLTGENGLMKRTTETRAATSIGEAKDECILIATETVTDYYEDIYVKQNGTYDVSELDQKLVTAINTNSDLSGRIRKNDSKLEISVAGEGTGAKITLTYTDNRLTSTATGTVNDGKIIWDNISTADGESSRVSGIKDASGNEITPSSLSVGDKISIDDQDFMVIVTENANNTIVAIAWDNITLSTTNPVQDSSAGKTKFSDSPYWAGTTKDMDMDGANYVQQYITAYAKTLADKGASGITTRIARDGDVRSLDGQKNSADQYLLSPSKARRELLDWFGSFWQRQHCARCFR